MAFPVIVGSTTGYSASSGTQTIYLPGGTQAGDLLLLCRGEFGTENIVDIVTRTASSGDVSAGYFTHTTGDSSAWICYAIRNWADVEIEGPIINASASPNAGAMSGSWGIADNLWFSVAAWEGDISHTSYPNNYTGGQATTRFADPDTGVGVAAAARENFVATEDPDNHSLSDSANWGATCVVVRPMPNSGSADCPIILSAEVEGSTIPEGSSVGEIVLSGQAVGYTMPIGSAECGIVLDGEAEGEAPVVQGEGGALCQLNFSAEAHGYMMPEGASVGQLTLESIVLGETPPIGATGPILCCCPERCLIFSDFFDRADSTVTQWAERSGDWEIASNELAEAGNNGALIIAPQWHSRLTWFLVTGLGAGGIVSGAIYRLIANYVDDSNYYYAEYEYDENALTVTIRIGSTAGGVFKEDTWHEDVVADDMVAPYVNLSLCLDPETFNATLYNRTTRFICVDDDPFTLNPFGRKFGLGNGGGTPITYDDFYAEETSYYDPLCRDCPPLCCARCDNWEWDERDGYWFWTGPLCMQLSSQDCPELLTLAGLNPAPPPVDTDPVDGYWIGYTEGYFANREVHLWCDKFATEAGCFRYRFQNLSGFSTGFEGGDCGVSDVYPRPPDDCQCPDIDDFNPAFGLVWYTKVYNSGGGDCDTFCQDGIDVTITIACCPDPPAMMRSDDDETSRRKAAYLDSTRRVATKILPVICQHRGELVGHMKRGCASCRVYSCGKHGGYCSPNSPQSYGHLVGSAIAITSSNHRSCAICRANGDDE